MRLCVTKMFAVWFTVGVIIAFILFAVSFYLELMYQEFH